MDNPSLHGKHITQELPAYTRVDSALVDESRGIWTKLNNRTFQKWQQDPTGPRYFVFVLAPMGEDRVRGHTLGQETCDTWRTGYRLYEWAFAVEGLVDSLHQFLRELPRVSIWVFEQRTE